MTRCGAGRRDLRPLWRGLVGRTVPCMRIGDVAVLDTGGLDALLHVLRDRGFDVLGPVVRDGAVVPGPLAGVVDLPVGWHDEQEPGRYRLAEGDDDELFGWAVGPGSWKAELFPPSQELWRTTAPGHATGGAGPGAPAGPGASPPPRPLAMVGARPCELAGLAVLDRVLMGGAVPDPRYDARRRGSVVVVAECGAPSGTCFCTSMGTGPGVDGGEGEGYDLALTELGAGREADPPGSPDTPVSDTGGHRLLVRVGSTRGAELLDQVPTVPATERDLEARRRVLARASGAMGRHLDAEGVPALLERNLDHPRWADVAERCLACGNCTLVCPTCFCSDVRDTTDLAGATRRTRTWASCFDLDHSYLHGGPVRSSVSSRYRQWLTHKLSTWWDQFGTSGCVGCGRCITWCPVGIDLTEEVAAIQASDGARADVKVP